MDKSDKVWFDKALRIVLAASGGWFKPKKEIIAHYWEQVHNYSLEEVKDGLSALSRTYTKGHVSPADLRNAVDVSHAAYLRELEFKKNRNAKPVDPRGLEFSKMKGAAAPMFARRLLNMRELPIRLGRDDYTGSFDYKMIVTAVPIPEGLDLLRTEKVWKAFFTALGYEWDQWELVTESPVSPSKSR